jgi:hypothetical protein
MGDVIATVYRCQGLFVGWAGGEKINTEGTESGAEGAELLGRQEKRGLQAVGRLAGPKSGAAWGFNRRTERFRDISECPRHDRLRIATSQARSPEVTSALP